MKTRLLLSIAAAVLAAVSYAQTPTWPKDTVDGVVVYRYTVQKSEGLYRISKNFEVTQEELVRLNPQLQTEGLKYGQTILVPVKDAPEVKATGETEYIKHVIQAKETLYGLSKKYGVSVDELQAANPTVSQNMPIGATLLIPTGKKAASKPAEQEVEEVVITDYCKVSEKPKKGLRTDLPRQQKKPEELGKNKEMEPAAAATPEALPKDTATTPLDTVAPVPAEEAATEPAATAISAIPLRIAYLLPLQADAAKRDNSMDRFVDFYEGALLAIYEAQQNGQHFDIYT